MRRGRRVPDHAFPATLEVKFVIESLSTIDMCGFSVSVQKQDT